MSNRLTEFYTVLDRMAEGAYTSDTIASPDIIRDDEAYLARLASTALHAVGMTHRRVYFGDDFEEAGSTSVVRELRVQSDDTEHDASYAMRIQPTGLVDEYAPASDLARTLARRNGVPTPRIYAAQADAQVKSPHAFTIEDFAKGANGYDYCNDNPDRLPSVARELGGLLVRIHRQGVQGFGFFDIQAAKQGELKGQHDSYRAHVTAGLGQTVARLLQYEQLNDAQTAALDEYFRETPVLDRLSENQPVLLHGDPALYNLRVPNNMPPTIIDFGETRGGPPLHDLAVTSLDLTRDGWESAAADVLAGYEAAGGELPPYTEEALTAIRLRHLLSVVAGQARFLHDNPRADGMRPFFSRAVTALHRDAATLRIFSSARR